MSGIGETLEMLEQLLLLTGHVFCSPVRVVGYNDLLVSASVRGDIERAGGKEQDAQRYAEEETHTE